MSPTVQNPATQPVRQGGLAQEHETAPSMPQAQVTHRAGTIDTSALPPPPAHLIRKDIQARSGIPGQAQTYLENTTVPDSRKLVFDGASLHEKGRIQFSGDPESGLTLDRNAPRLAAVLDKAAALKNGASVSDIATEIVSETHRQYGAYNKEIGDFLLRQSELTGEIEALESLPGSDRARISKLRKELAEAQLQYRAMRGERDKGKKDVDEFQKGSLVCTEYAPITSLALTEAGISNSIISGRTVSSPKEPGVMHVTVAAGNKIIEATDPKAAVRTIVSGDLESFEKGEPIVSISGAGNLSIIGSASDSILRSQLESHNARLQMGLALGGLRNGSIPVQNGSEVTYVNVDPVTALELLSRQPWATEEIKTFAAGHTEISAESLYRAGNAAWQKISREGFNEFLCKAASVPYHGPTPDSDMNIVYGVAASILPTDVLRKQPGITADVLEDIATMETLAKADAPKERMEAIATSIGRKIATRCRELGISPREVLELYDREVRKDGKAD